ncbi:MAG: hypothetical protein EA378_09460 [Phycisphaerales bacterium]|nr:MAG: hypothetical protein EA378_09460 [Phycisphaerales bacterium]
MARITNKARASGRGRERGGGSKQSRILALDPFIRSGQLLFSQRQTTLLEQLQAYPLGAHDDGPDALELCVSRACLRSDGPYSNRTIGM